jgi:ABC-type lipoprotein release transport system permease subunit
VSPGEIRPPSGPYLQSLEVTPAFVQEAGLRTQPYLGVRLRSGATIADFTAQAEKAGYPVDVAIDRIANGAALQEAIRPSQLSLAVLAVLLAVGALAVLGQLLVRSAGIEANEAPVLAALGMRPRDLAAQDALRGVTIALLASAVAIVVAIAASPIMPIGIARQAEPHPGIAVDAFVIGLGVAVIVLFVTAVTVVAGQLARSRRRARTTSATLANAIARADVSPSFVSGTNLALTRGSGASAVPVLSSLISVVLAVALIVGALTFAAGISHLRTTPRLVGWNWSLGVFVPDVVRSPAERARVRASVDEQLAGDEKIVAASPSVLFSPFPQQRVLELGRQHLDVPGMVAFDGRSDVGPSIIDGRKPVADDEIALGPDTLRDLGLELGDKVDAYGAEGTSDQEEPGRRTHARMEVVGTAVIPQAGQLGEGAALTLDGLAKLNSRAQDQLYFVRVAPGTSAGYVVERFREMFPRAPADQVSVFGSEQAGADDPLLKLDTIDTAPVALTVMTIALAAIVLGHVFLSSMRARRRDVAVLRVLGFSRGQTIRAVGWQACVYAFVALAIGIPLGLLAGRFAWNVYARDLGVVPEAAMPWIDLGLTVILALALTALAAAPAAWHAVRTRPAVLLRSE